MTALLTRPADRATERTADRRPARRVAPAPVLVDVVDEWGRQSFPASDPPPHR